jgi:predicted permease
MSSLISDLRYAMRTLWKVRGFSVVAVLTLALGIGANTAIFSVLNGIVLKPLPYEEPDRVVRVWPMHTFSKSLIVELRQQATSYSELSGFSSVNMTLTGMGDPEEFFGASVSVNHFNLLGVAPALGRTFLPEEQEPGQGQVVILSHGLWERRFGAAPNIIGQTVQLGGTGGESRTVVGIMPRDYRPVMERWRAWLPMTIDATNFSDYEGTAGSMVIGRLREGVSVDLAQSELRSFAERLKAEGDFLQWVSDEAVSGATVVPALDALVGEVRSRLVVLFVAVGLVLLIGCTNVANLLLARGTSRSGEIGIRLAIGARRSRVVRQLLTEALFLGVIGGGVGLCAATWTVSVLKAGLPPGVPRTDLITIDLRVLGFAFGVSLLASLVFGLLPALRTTGGNVRSALHEGARGASVSGGRLRLNGGLVVVETALAVVLVVAAGLMLKSFWLLSRVDPGFDAENLVTMRVSPRRQLATQMERVCAHIMPTWSSGSRELLVWCRWG